MPPLERRRVIHALALMSAVLTVSSCAAFQPGGRFSAALYPDCGCYEEVVHFPGSKPAEDQKNIAIGLRAGSAKDMGTDAYLDAVYEGMRRDFEANGIKLTPVPDGFRATGIKVEKKREQKKIRELLVSIDGDISFAHGSGLVTPQAQVVLDRVAKVLSAYPDINIKVGGHTDSTGAKAYNYQLSRERANATTDLLVAKSKIARTRVVEIQGFADDQKLVDTMLAEVRNRRVEIRMAP